MFNIIQKVGKNNWIFGEYYNYRNKWRACFTKNVHGDIEFVLYDYLFTAMENERFESKKDLHAYCKAQIKKFIPKDI